MSGSMAPDPPVAGARGGLFLRFGLIIAIGFLWTVNNPRPPPGEPDSPTETAKVSKCRFGHPANILLDDGTYVCRDGHEAVEPE
jgi:hypothetical protein